MSRIISYSKNCLYSPVISRKWTHKIPKTVVFVHLSSFGISVVKVFLQYINCCGPTFRANKVFKQLKMFTKKTFLTAGRKDIAGKPPKILTERQIRDYLSIWVSVCDHFDRWKKRKKCVFDLSSWNFIFRNRFSFSPLCNFQHN